MGCVATGAIVIEGQKQAEHAPAPIVSIMSKIIKAIDYTAEIRECINKLEYRMASTLTDYEPEDFLVVKSDDTYFVLANPVLGEEAIYDDFGRVKEYIPVQNITLIYYDDPPETETPEYEFCLPIRLPRLRILRLDLCLKIEDGKVIDCTPADLESVAIGDWERQIKDLVSRLWDYIEDDCSIHHRDSIGCDYG